MSDDTDLNSRPSASDLIFDSSKPYNFDDEFNSDEEICRVCRVSGEGKLFHPCLCSGSIKFVHQECLLQWLKYSKKEVCELCNHKFSFKPVYDPSMPKSLPINDLAKGVFLLFVKFLKTILMYIFVATCWLILVPLVASRTHQMVFNGLISSIFSSRLFNFFSLENLSLDIIRGWLIMSLFVCTFIALVWLREQVNVGNGQEINIGQVPVRLPPENNPREREQRALQEELQALLMDDNPEGLADDDNDNANPAQDPVAEQPNNNAGRDVEQFVENMTWQRLLGFDGSFVFLENVFWVISLNFVFHVVFLLCPSFIGSTFLRWLGLSDQINYFKTAISIFVGYFIIVQVVYLWHCIFKKLEYHSMSQFTQVSYLVIKVLLLVITELAIFPIICGWWLDLCSLSLTGSSLTARLKTFSVYPLSSTVLHWMAGMLYVFYSASLILNLRSLLRPGVLWFIRNLNDPDFSPVNEMIQQPFQKHCRRLVASTTLFLSIIFLVVYCPLRIIKACTSNIIPYVLTSSDGQYAGFSLELMLLQIILPSTLEYMRAFTVLDWLVKKWCVTIGRRLKLDTYLLSRRDLEEADRRNNPPPQNEQPARPNEGVQAGQGNAQQPNDLAGRHHALLAVRDNQEIETYIRPDHFQLRLVALLVCLAITIVVVALILLIVPVTVGRLILICIGVGTHAIQDIYSVAIGFYASWLMIKLCLVAMDWVQKGREYVNDAMKKAVHLLLKIALAVIPILGVIPLLLSLYFQLLIIGPLRVSISQSPLFFPLKEWGMGILHLKIICATLLMGPDNWLKTALEQIYADGFRGIRLRTLYVDIVFPVMNALTLLIVAPYVVVRSILLCLDLTPEENATIVRFSFPCLLLAILAILYLKWTYKKLCSLHQRLRDERYLVGTQLVNLYRTTTSTS